MENLTKQLKTEKSTKPNTIPLSKEKQHPTAQEAAQMLLNGLHKSNAKEEA